MTATLALTSALWDELRGALDHEHETAGIVAARSVEGPRADDGSTSVAYLGRRLTWAPPASYLERHSYGLELGSAGWVPATRAALAEGSIPVFIHTHPRGRPEFSKRDDGVDASLLAALPAMGGGGTYMALVGAGTSQVPTAAARVYYGSADLLPVPYRPSARLRGNSRTRGAQTAIPPSQRRSRLRDQGADPSAGEVGDVGG